MGKHKIKQIVSFFCLLIAFCNTFCNNKSAVYRQLEEVERLFSENKDSMAAAIIKEITPPKDTTETLALYNYLYAKMYARNNKFLPSNILDYSIEHFENTNDSIRLSYAYNYKSIFTLNENNKKEARKLNYASERIARNLNDDILLFNIYSNGYMIAAHHYDTDECLSYANEAYLTGLKLHDIRRMAYPAIFLTMCYNEKKIPDSTKKYMAVCLNFINDYDDYTRSMVYNVFGDVLSQTDDTMSEHYYKESVSINNNEDAYNGLTQLYLKQGKIQQADTCYQKALRPKAYETNLNLMELYADKLETTQNYSKSMEIRKQMYITLDSLYNEKVAGLDERIASLEKNNNNADVHTQNVETILIIYKTLTIVFALLIFILVIIKRKPAVIVGSNIIPDDEPSENKDDDEPIQTDENIEKGKKLFDKIITNENISQLNKSERLQIISYYQTIDANFFEDLSNSYDKLPVNAILILILLHIGKDKSYIIDTMGFSDQAFRSLKSRIEKLKKTTN